MRNRVVRLAAAVVLIPVAMAVSPSGVSACSGPPLTFEQVVTQSELIVEGEIEEVLLDGLAYRIAVDEVFKGSSTATSVRIGPQADSGERGCEVGLSRGDHVILGVVDVTQRLNSLATGVWFVAEDGSLSSPGSLWEVATDVTEVREKLRQALPDTALANPTSDDPSFEWPLGLLALGVAAAIAFRRGGLRPKR